MSGIIRCAAFRGAAAAMQRCRPVLASPGQRLSQGACGLRSCRRAPRGDHRRDYGSSRVQSYGVVWGDVSEGDNPAGTDPAQLFLYTKGDCPLCDGLHEKLEAVLEAAQFKPSRLTGAKLEVRDIEDNEEWKALYYLQVPVVTAINTRTGDEVVLPRVPPRTTAAKLSQHLLKHLPS
ncbi:unnamed protein product [Pedinophyceae sp. YPF-701]|nr:unnamed protein product [Pedinophyceae sp. YPF-701]